MIEIRVNVGAFEMTIGDLLELEVGKVYQWQLESEAPLSLYVGSEKIAEAALLSDQDGMFVQVTQVLDEA